MGYKQPSTFSLWDEENLEKYKIVFDRKQAAGCRLQVTLNRIQEFTARRNFEKKTIGVNSFGAAIEMMAKF